MDKEFITTLIAIVGGTAAIMSKMATKKDVREVKIELKEEISRLDRRLDSLGQQQHNDAMTLQRDIVTLHDRVAKVEKH